MTKRSFFEWMGQQLDKHIRPNQLLREFEKKFGQLPLAKKQFLKMKKRLEEVVSLIAKQKYIKFRGFEARIEAIPMKGMKAPTITFLTLTPSSSLRNKNVDKEIFNELMKSMKELKIEITTLKKDIRLGTLRPTEGSKGFMVKYIWYNDPNKKRGGCGLYTDAIKNDIITFKEGKIKDVATNDPPKTNFGRRGMRKLIDDRLERNSSSLGKEAQTYTIEIEYIKVETSTHVSKEVMVKGAQAIRRPIRWDDPIDGTTIRTYLVSEQGEKESYV
uniref:Predicted protein n=1 Tax=Physcomitrium patens TaxID=3218 RepID=A9U098_PHYPA